MAGVNGVGAKAEADRGDESVHWDWFDRDEGESVFDDIRVGRLVAITGLVIAWCLVILAIGFG